MSATTGYLLSLLHKEFFFTNLEAFDGRSNHNLPFKVFLISEDIFHDYDVIIFFKKHQRNAKLLKPSSYSLKEYCEGSMTKSRQQEGR